MPNKLFQALKSSIGGKFKVDDAGSDALRGSISRDPSEIYIFEEAETQTSQPLPSPHQFASPPLLPPAPSQSSHPSEMYSKNVEPDHGVEKTSHLEDSASGIETRKSIPKYGSGIFESSKTDNVTKYSDSESKSDLETKDATSAASNASIYSFSGLQKFIEESFMMGISSSNFFKWKSTAEILSPPESNKGTNNELSDSQDAVMNMCEGIQDFRAMALVTTTTDVENHAAKVLNSAALPKEIFQTLDPAIFGAGLAVGTPTSTIEKESMHPPSKKIEKPPHHMISRKSEALSKEQRDAPTFATNSLAGRPPPKHLFRKMKKFNSCATLNVLETPCRGPLKLMVYMVAHAIRQMIVNSHSCQNFATHFVFTSAHALLKHGNAVYSHDYKIPTFEEIYIFLVSVFEGAELTSEIPIISLIYIDRLLRNSGYGIISKNWALMALGAILLASKIWDDLSVWNVDYCSIFPELTVGQIGELERVYLRELEFDLNIPQRLYFLYYSALHESFGEQATRPLGRQEGLILDAISRGTAFVRKAPSRPPQPLRQPNSSFQSAMLSVLRSARKPLLKKSSVVTGMASATLDQKSEHCPTQSSPLASSTQNSKKAPKSPKIPCGSEKRKEKLSHMQKNDMDDNCDLYSIRRVRSDYLFQDSKPAVMHY